jgi:cation diffusion facilitator family transporter
MSTSTPADPGRKVTLVGTAVNAFLIALKFAAGILGHSQGLIADAVHSASDLFTDAVVLFGLKAGHKPPDTKHPFGHGRIETLATAIVGLALIATALYLGFQAVLNIYHHTEYHPTGLALIGAAISIIAKESLYHYTVYTARRLKNQLIMANAWHHRSDALSSVAVLIGVAAARIKPAWYILDSVAALIVSFFIIKVGLQILINTLRELSDAAPKSEILDEINRCSLSVEGVVNAHDLKVRTSGGAYQVEIHIEVDGQLTVVQGHRIAKQVESCLTEELDDLDRVIVHVDPAEPNPINPPSEHPQRLKT